MRQTRKRFRPIRTLIIFAVFVVVAAVAVKAVSTPNPKAYLSSFFSAPVTHLKDIYHESVDFFGDVISSSSDDQDIADSGKSVEQHIADFDSVFETDSQFYTAEYLLANFPSAKACRATIYSTKDVTTKVRFEVEYNEEYKVLAVRENQNFNLLNPKELQIYNAVEYIIENAITADMTDFEKELTIHDFIINNCAYDNENYLNHTVPEDSFTSYGVLIKHTAVCEGYAKTFRMFMEALGIPCDFVVGKGNSGDHGWNRVRLDGEYYNVDVTWDDPVSDSGDTLSYRYFNVTDSAFSVNHTPTAAYSTAAVATKYNYFYYFDLVITSQEEFNSKIRAAINAGQREITLLCAGDLLAENIDRSIVFDYISATTFNQSIDKVMNTITIYV
ncbi:MAG: hypothetical protein LBN00_01980 [Oscillospiraceae bacterium]|nr:hypothetical protein [Oscillospiraceae bacterium]